MDTMSHKEYLLLTNKEDNRQSWIEWKIDIYNMSEPEATIASYDTEWGYNR